MLFEKVIVAWTLIDASKEVGGEVNTKKTKYMLLPRTYLLTYE